ALRRLRTDLRPVRTLSLAGGVRRARRMGVLALEGDGTAADDARRAARLSVVRAAQGALPRLRDAGSEELGERVGGRDALAPARTAAAQRVAQDIGSRRGLPRR